MQSCFLLALGCATLLSGRVFTANAGLKSSAAEESFSPWRSVHHSSGFHLSVVFSFRGPDCDLLPLSLLVLAEEEKVVDVCVGGGPAGPCAVVVTSLTGTSQPERQQSITQTYSFYAVGST